MDSQARRPYQGLINVIRFNWHYYLLAIALLLIVIFTGSFFEIPYNWLLVIIIVVGLFSLITPYYIYDRSNLYRLDWLDEFKIPDEATLINIHAGFDETSELLQRKYPLSALRVFDFYNPITHTEISIKRARLAYPAFPGTQIINTVSPDIEENSADIIFLILAFHEIRNDNEQMKFLQQLKLALKSKGKIIITEHSRDLINFIAFNIGFLHFFSKRHWMKIFHLSGLLIETRKITPFLTTYILSKDKSE